MWFGLIWATLVSGLWPLRVQILCLCLTLQNWPMWIVMISQVLRRTSNTVYLKAISCPEFCRIEARKMSSSMHCFMNIVLWWSRVLQWSNNKFVFAWDLMCLLFSNDLSNPIGFLPVRTSVVCVVIITCSNGVGGFHVQYHNYIDFFSISLGRNTHAYAMTWPVFFCVDVSTLCLHCWYF